MNKRLVITVTGSTEFPFLVETEFQNTLGYWNCMSRSTVKAFPWIIVNRVAGRKDYTIIVRVR